MPSNAVHCAISVKRTGKSYKELHRWIDFNSDERGVNHRNKNHFYSDELKQLISNQFGGAEAVSEWLFHIALDNLDTSVTNDWNYANVDRNFYQLGFEPDGFIHYDEDELEEEDMEEAFPEDFEYEN